MRQNEKELGRREGQRGKGTKGNQSKIRISKSETNSKFEYRMAETGRENLGLGLMEEEKGLGCVLSSVCFKLSAL